MTYRRPPRPAPADWSTMAPVDWLALTPADWMARTLGDWATRPAGDWLRAAYPPGPWAPARPQGGRPHEHGHHEHGHHEHGHHEHGHHEHGHHGCGCEHGHHGCGCKHDDDDCERCGEERCDCSCCVGDADLVVPGRLGETRVVPLVIANERRRERSVTLELSDWTSRGGRPAPVRTLSLSPRELTLAPCEEQTAVLVVHLGAAEQGKPPKGAEVLGHGLVEDHSLDVDDCEVAYADLRLVGCDRRPLRLAVAVLPRRCDALRVGCGCSCC